jgi:hypothetical protein
LRIPATSRAVFPALLATIGRFYVTESANWLHSRGSIDRATVAAGRLLKRTPQYLANIVLSQQASAGESHGGGSFMSLFNKRYRRATILASVPWFLQDLSTYGIGIFTPTILANNESWGTTALNLRTLECYSGFEGKTGARCPAVDMHNLAL